MITIPSFIDTQSATVIRALADKVAAVEQSYIDRLSSLSSDELINDQEALNLIECEARMNNLLTFAYLKDAICNNDYVSIAFNSNRGVLINGIELELNWKLTPSNYHYTSHKAENESYIMGSPSMSFQKSRIEFGGYRKEIMLETLGFRYDGSYHDDNGVNWQKFTNA